MARVTARWQRRRILTSAVVIAIMTALFALTHSERADVVFVNGIVHALDSTNRTFEAFAVVGGRIVDLGSNDEMGSRYDADSSVDLQGRTVIPGFIDAHGRLLNAGMLSLTVDVSRAGSAREAVRIVAAHARAIPAGTWIRGRGWVNAWWDDEDERPLTLLDSATSEHPVVLVGEHGTTAWVNSRALTSCGFGLGRTEHEPPGVVRDRHGEALGIVLDEASEVVLNSLPGPTDWELNAALDSAALDATRAGITTVHDFGLSLRELALYEQRAAQGSLPVRIYAVIGGTGQTWEAIRARGPLIGIGGGMLTARAVELYVDGALESRSAALLEPYSDEPATRGLTFADERELAVTVRSALEGGFQVCMNATGDRAVRIALNVFGVASEGLSVAPGMLRLEGVQLIESSDLARAESLGVTISMQPAHYVLDFGIAATRLGPERMERFMAWDEVLASGLKVAGGTDMPLAPADPFFGISLVATRSSPRWDARARPDTLKALLESLRMFTAWPARAGLEQLDKGSLEPGKLADFIVLSDDPFRVGAGGLAQIRVLETFVGGRTISAQRRSE